MTRICVLLLAFFAAEASRVTPIQKVITLLNGLLTDSQKAKTTEAVAFGKFDQWCKDQDGSKKGEIKADETKIEKENAKLEKAVALIKETDNRIKELEQDVGRWTKDQKSASDVRQQEKTDYTATNTNLQETVEALDGAIKTLGAQPATRAQALFVQTTLLQIQSRHRSAPPMPAELMNTLTALTQESASNSQSDSLSESVSNALAESNEALSSDDESVGTAVTAAALAQAPAAGYEFQSGGVVDMLKKLRTNFAEEQTKLQKTELDAQNAYEKMRQQLVDNVKGADTELVAKRKLLATTQQAKADAEDTLTETKKELAGDETNLKDTTAMCQLKTSDFNSRKKLREDEIVAISKAIGFIDSDAVKGSGDKHLPSFFQMQSKKKSAVFAHLRSDSQSPEQGQLIMFLTERSRTLGSTMLMDVAQRVSAGPFVKVKKMVKDLIIKLMEESTAETENKGWCDTELTTNKQTRDRKTDDIEELDSDIEDLTATVQQLAQDLSDLQEAVKALDKAMIERTAERQKDKEAAHAQIADAKAAISAVEQAIAVLKDFYAQSAEATAFVQAGAAPETFDDAYQGNQSQGGGIIDLLEVILSDFTRLESEATSNEAEEVESYKNFMFESAQDRALKAGMIMNKEAKKTDKETAKQTAEEDQKTTQEALDKAIKVYDKLKPKCVDSGISYQERVQKREEEIQSLQDALKILSA